MRVLCSADILKNVHFQATRPLCIKLTRLYFRLLQADVNKGWKGQGRGGRRKRDKEKERKEKNGGRRAR